MVATTGFYREVLLSSFSKCRVMITNFFQGGFDAKRKMKRERERMREKPLEKTLAEAFLNHSSASLLDVNY